MLTTYLKKKMPLPWPNYYRTLCQLVYINVLSITFKHLCLMYVLKQQILKRNNYLDVIVNIFIIFT